MFFINFNFFILEAIILETIFEILQETYDK